MTVIEMILDALKKKKTVGFRIESHGETCTCGIDDLMRCYQEGGPFPFGCEVQHEKN